jgi:hypothetical protein
MDEAAPGPVETPAWLLDEAPWAPDEAPEVDEAAPPTVDVDRGTTTMTVPCPPEVAGGMVTVLGAVRFGSVTVCVV